MKLIYKTQIEGQKAVKLDRAEVSSVMYHDIFNYPLTFSELVKWRVGSSIVKNEPAENVVFRRGFYCLEGAESFVISRLMRRRASKSKMSIAKKAAKLLATLPSIKMVAISGALAMRNADDSSDIDLLVITSKNTLWFSRLASLSLLKLLRIKTRRYGDKNEKDKICLNMWLDESNLVWRKRNLYTAHELEKLRPLVNKNNSYEQLLKKNAWIKKYWPNAVAVRRQESRIKNQESTKKKAFFSAVIHNSFWLSLKLCLFIIRILEPFARKMQFLYMKSKVTRETITPTRAIFHPIDWANVIVSKYNLRS